MLNRFGKISRKLRIDHNELLLEMAEYLGVSPAFLSKTENGKAKPPVDWKYKIKAHYNLDEESYAELCESIDEARRVNTLRIHDINESDTDLMLAFARKINDMSDHEKENLRKKFNI